MKRLKCYLLLTCLILMTGCGDNGTNSDGDCYLGGKNISDSDTAIAYKDVAIDHFPSCVFYHPNVRYFLFANNGISQLPEEIKNLTNLEYLFIDENPLIELPGGFCELQKLLWLSIHGSKLTHIPDSIGKLKNLLYLHLGYNDELIELPESIGDLESLEELSVEFCPIERFPDSIKKLKNHLKKLWFSGTNMSDEYIDSLRVWLPYTNL
jgi:Leucine-rich repeat (LRR) protein